MPQFGTDPTPVPVLAVDEADEVRPLALTGSAASLPSSLGLGLTAVGCALLALDRRLRRREEAAEEISR